MVLFSCPENDGVPCGLVSITAEKELSQQPHHDVLFETAL